MFLWLVYGLLLTKICYCICMYTIVSIFITNIYLDFIHCQYMTLHDVSETSASFFMWIKTNHKPYSHCRKCDLVVVIILFFVQHDFNQGDSIYNKLWVLGFFKSTMHNCYLKNVRNWHVKPGIYWWQFSRTEMHLQYSKMKENLCVYG
jgi:hypothetical protein